MSTPSGQPNTLVGVSGLSKAIHGKPIVVDIDITVASNEIVGLVGPNGAGKTTTLRLLAGLLRPDAGEGRICGRAIGRLGGSDPQVGYMSQKIGLYEELTVEQNLRFRAEAYRAPKPRDAVEEALTAHDLCDRRRTRVRELSGGWARRVQLAAVLLPRPRLLLLDEPTAGLDARSRRALWRRLVDYVRDGAGVIVNTHDLEEAELCDRVALFRHGRVVAEGRPEHLIAAAGLGAGVIDGDVDPAELSDALGRGSSISISSQGRGVRIVAPAARLPDLLQRISAMGLTVVTDRPRLSDIALASEDAAVSATAP